MVSAGERAVTSRDAASRYGPKCQADERGQRETDNRNLAVIAITLSARLS